MKKVLIVDDNQQNLYLLESIIKSMNYGCLSASNGKEALEIAAKNQPDLIISDILMPVMDGFEFCRQCKLDENLKQIPFVFYTATYTEPRDEQFAMNLGADRFLIKPLKPEVLRDIVTEFLEEKKTRPPAVQTRPDDSKIFQQYNEVLFHKLEKKLGELQKEVQVRKNVEEALRVSVREKEVILQELYHRTFNNMQVINGMLNLQASRLKDAQVRGIFKDMVNRIFSMSLIHKKLYESGNLYEISLKDYIFELVQMVKSSYHANGVEFDLEGVTEVPAMVVVAIPFGIVLNELLTNSVKHAFACGAKGVVKVSLEKTGKESFTLKVTDNGCGLPKQFDYQTDSGLGLRFVRDIVENQLNGTVSFCNQPGLEVTVKVNDKKN